MKIYTLFRFSCIQIILMIFFGSSVLAQFQSPKASEIFRSNAADGEKKQLKLEWDMGGEAGVKVFIVERSSDKENFVPLATIDAGGNSVNLFSFLDKTPLSGLSFYRIKRMKADDSFTYSKVLPVSNVIDRKYALNFYPNPASRSLTISAQGSQPQGQITINNMDGRPIFSIRVMSSIVETALDISYLATGTYLLIYSDTKGEVVRQFIKN